MPITDLAEVTRTLTKFIYNQINDNDSFDDILGVSASAPDKVTDKERHLSLYMYHIAEDPTNRNITPEISPYMASPGGQTPASTAPMSLELYYVLTAHHDSLPNDANVYLRDPEKEQEILGYALKVLHDTPIITDANTMIDVDNGSVEVPALSEPLRGKNNRIEIILRPISPEDALPFWSGEDAQVARLSAYYKVRVMFLEPEKPETSAGPVLSVGTYIFQLGAPYIECSENTLEFGIPSLYGGGVSQLSARPARVAEVDTNSTSVSDNEFVLAGQNLSSGIRQRLRISGPIYSSPGANTYEEIEGFAEIEMERYPSGSLSDWKTDFDTDRVDVRIHPVLERTHPTTGAAQNLYLAPGIYRAQTRSINADVVGAGPSHEISSTSNVTTFTVAPIISGDTKFSYSGDDYLRINFELGTGSLLDQLHNEIFEEPGAIEVVIDGFVYTRKQDDPDAGTPVAAPLDLGDFVTRAVEPAGTTDMPTGSLIIRPRADFSFTPTSTQAHALRITINGAESAPYWVIVS